jgi:hypothetical protein
MQRALVVDIDGKRAVGDEDGMDGEAEPPRETAECAAERR